MVYVSVKGGTRAGWRTQREPIKWVCDCGHEQRGYSAACCGARRPS